MPADAAALTALAEDHLGQSEARTVAGDLPGARALLEAVREAPGWPGLAPSLRARVLTDLGWISGALMELDRAGTELGEAVRLAEQSGQPGALQDALLEAGAVERYASRYAEAEATYRRAQEVACDPAARARAVFGRAVLAMLTFDFLGARELLQLAAESAEQVPAGQAADLLWADICRERGVVHRLAGEFDEAEQALLRAGELYERHGRLTGAGNIQRELGALRSVLGDFGEARRYLDAAYAFYERAQRPLGMAAICRRKGDLEVDAGRLDEAGELMLQAGRLFGADAYGLTRVALSLGRIARLASRPGAAAERLEQAEQLASAHSDLAALSEIALERGRLARDAGDRQDALGYFQLALAGLGQEPPPDAESLVRHNLALELTAAGRPEEALPHAMRDVEICEQLGYPLGDPYHRTTFYDRHRAGYLQAIHVAALCGDGLAALRVATAARSDALAAFIQDGSTQLGPQLRRQIADLRIRQESHRLAASARTAQAPAGGGGLSAGLEAAYAELERQTSAALRTVLESAPPDLRELQRSLPTGGHALLLDQADDDPRICWAIWLPAAGEPEVHELLLPEDLHELLSSFAGKAPDIAWRPHRREFAELGALLVPDGLARALRTAKRPPPLVISSGSALAAFPMAALELGRQPLARLAELSWVPSLKVWQALARRPVRGGAGSAACLRAGLPGSRQEERALRKSIPPLQVLASGDVRDALGHAGDLRALVLSAHGNAESGLAQALILDDGLLLTAAELLQARLPGLVIMGACWSGAVPVQAAREPLGLPTAALLGGASCVIAGLVDVGSSSAGRILSRFYQEIAAGAAYAAALRIAQLSYLRRHPRALPAQWAGLIAVGNGTAALPPAAAG
jgi:tetratricopeptide (TPR) repeat protein